MLNAFQPSPSGKGDDLSVASLGSPFCNVARRAHVKPPSVQSHHVRGAFADARKVIASTRISTRGERNE